MTIRTIARAAAALIAAHALAACDAPEEASVSESSDALRAELLDVRIDGRAAAQAYPGAPVDIELSAAFEPVDCSDCRVQIVVHLDDEAHCVADSPATGGLSVSATVPAPTRPGDHLVRWAAVMGHDCADALGKVGPNTKPEPVGAVSVVPVPAPENTPPRLIGREITPATHANGCETRVRYGAEDFDGDGLTYTMVAGREIFRGVDEISIPRRESGARTVAIVVSDGRGGVDFDLVRLDTPACAMAAEMAPGEDGVAPELTAGAGRIHPADAADRAAGEPDVRD